MEFQNTSTFDGPSEEIDLNKSLTLFKPAHLFTLFVTLHTMRIRLTLAAALLLTLTGCRSPYVETTIANRTGGEISDLQVEYPSASFGKNTLPNGADFHYRFKIQGSGPVKVSYADAEHHDHAITGPTLYEGQHGTLRIDINLPDNVEFAPVLVPAH
jgi:hypothetical protein